jgi:UDP-N-acetylglucosamine 2-epimerase (non-hydrolysing)
MIDSLIQNKNKFSSSKILTKLKLQKGKYILSTIHRPANVDSRQNLTKVISIFKKVSAEALKYDSNVKIVLPLHPRTMKMIEKFGFTERFRQIKNLIITEPVGYTDFIKLLMDSMLVITDSGGVQEEATFLGIPCLTLRDSFERLDTIKLGSNTLCNLDEGLILKKTREIFTGKYKKGKRPHLMDGKASKRIVNIIKSNIL